MSPSQVVRHRQLCPGALEQVEPLGVLEREPVQPFGDRERTRRHRLVPLARAQVRAWPWAPPAAAA
jgi:hypothetical protein